MKQPKPAHKTDSDVIEEIKSQVTKSGKRSEEFLARRFKVTGTNQNLEKCYLRLTCLPDASTVRPLHVLQKSLVHVMKKYLSGREDHNFILGGPD